MVKRLVVALLVLVVLIVSVYAEDEKDKKLTVDDIFPPNRVIQISLFRRTSRQEFIFCPPYRVPQIPICCKTSPL